MVHILFADSFHQAYEDEIVPTCKEQTIPTWVDSLDGTPYEWPSLLILHQTLRCLRYSVQCCMDKERALAKVWLRSSGCSLARVVLNVPSKIATYEMCVRSLFASGSRHSQIPSCHCSALTLRKRTVGRTQEGAAEALNRQMLEISSAKSMAGCTTSEGHQASQ